MSTEQHNLTLARQCLDRARMEETPTGDPLVGARNYLTAMEYIQAAAASVASSIKGAREQDFFLYQVKGKLAVYEERVKLLLGAAREMSMPDDPEAITGMSSLFTANSPSSIDELLRNMEIPASQPITKTGTLSEA